jgi:hypothetical protein
MSPEFDIANCSLLFCIEIMLCMQAAFLFSFRTGHQIGSSSVFTVTKMARMTEGRKVVDGDVIFFIHQSGSE